MKKQIAILGSTGSIGTQALQVIEEQSDQYEAYVLTANNRVEELIAQARKFKPEAVVIANETKYAQLKEALADLPVHRVFGELNMVLFAEHVDHVEADVVPCSGVFPARIAQADHNEHICLRFPKQPMRERRRGRSR